MTETEAISVFLKTRGYEALEMKAVLFDMDGVLFDSMKNHTLAWYEAVTSLGIPCTRDEFYQYEGATGKWTVNTIFGRTFGREATETEVNELYALKSKYFNRLPEAPPMPGAKQVLQQVRDAGLTPVLVTGSGQRSLLERLEKEFPGIFTPATMVTAFDVEKGKPDPEPYLKGLAKVNLSPSEAMVVENAPLGVQAGVAAGIFTVAVNTGPVPERQLRDAGANMVYPGMLSLASGFESIYKGCSFS